MVNKIWTENFRRPTVWENVRKPRGDFFDSHCSYYYYYLCNKIVDIRRGWSSKFDGDRAVSIGSVRQAKAELCNCWSDTSDVRACGQQLTMTQHQ